ncbi:YycH family regulatory protein [Levilactobacillus bambusae]|nr:two-component system activity regulator YycH [Levilactobacillus bambusae]
MKLTKSLLPITLGITVIISIILSGLIWTNPAHLERNHQSSGTSTSTNLNSRPMQDIYLPTQAVYTTEAGHAEQLSNRKVNLMSEIRSQIQGWQDHTTVKESQVSRRTYMAYLKQKDSLTLSYPSAVTVKTLNKVFKFNVRLAPNTEVNRIMIPQTEPDTFYFLSDSGYHVYRIQIKRSNPEALTMLLKGDLVRLPVRWDWLNNQAMTYYTSSVKMASYSYLMNHQSADYFVNRLMNSGENTNINVKRNKDSVTYSDGSTRNLTIVNRDNTAIFEDYGTMKSLTTYTDRLQYGYQSLVSTGVPMENVRFFDYNARGKKLTYRSYVEGFPIFNQTNYGAVQISALSGNVHRFNFSLYSLQVPVPADEADKTLASTDTVLNRLTAAGLDKAKINGLQLGYKWSESSSSDKVVNLAPTWYINYDGRWETYQDLMGE